jgi:hypothetical protein
MAAPHDESGESLFFAPGWHALCEIVKRPAFAGTRNVNDFMPSHLEYSEDPFTTGEAMLERARQVSRSVDERILKLIARAHLLIEHIDSYGTPLSR